MQKKSKQPSGLVRIWPSIRRLVKLSGRGESLLYLALAIALITTVINILLNHLMRRFIDSVPAGDFHGFWLYLGLYVGTWLVALPLGYLRTRSIGSFSERTLAAIRRKIAAHATHVPVRYLEDHHSGEMLSILNADLAKVKKLMASDLLMLTRDITLGIGALIYISFLSWQLTLISTLLVPLAFWGVSKLTTALSKRTEQMQEDIGQVNSIAQDGLGGLLITRAFNLTRILDERFRQVNSRALSKGVDIARRRAVVETVGYMVGMMPFIITFGYGGYLVINGKMTFGSIYAFINLLNFVTNPLTEIPNLWASIGESAGAAQRIFHLLDESPERQGGAVHQPVLDADPLIQFDGVSYAYQAGMPVLEDVTYSIRKGEKVAIVGPSGSGKTTILKLLMGFYPIDIGKITVFGAGINDWQLAALRQQMAFVAQDAYLFPVSIGENIRCGKGDASESDIEAAAKAANIHDFVLSLPETYGTLAGERGARLSGGERQRIALARAILKDAPLLLLDEATSALDSESEALVQEALERFMVNRTTLVIAHRLSTIKNADRVLVLDAGRIVESGTHAELFAKGGLYRNLYMTQFAQNGTADDGQKENPAPAMHKLEAPTNA
jgi:ABC-type multidrug transport system fused ATPase/permease subunit